MTFSACIATRQAVCPGCGTVSGRVHGVYRSRLADVAVSGLRAMIDLLVRRFICPARECDRRTFVEQVDGLTERLARRSPAAGKPGEASASAASSPWTAATSPSSRERSSSFWAPTAQESRPRSGCC
ncbi:transposase family protein [Kitasatospora camelliae]|uniref:Transposase family protein n=1 Tax=Kitasatospora camelliae TaxID=3156397 RepID=A0AAU8K743_9ACTN